MKKFFAKLALFTIISLIANSIFISIALAAPTATTPNEPSAEQILELANALNDLEECIDLTPKDSKKTKDEDYLITIIEEPLSLKSDESNEEYKTRICYRNSFQYWADKDYKKKYTLNVLAKAKEGDPSSGCSKKAGDLANKPNETSFNPRFTCRPVQVILSKGGTSQIQGFIKQVYVFASSIVGIIAVAVIIISGMQISLGGGDTESINSAKDRIIKSLSGLAILFLSGLILYTINPTFFTK